MLNVEAHGATRLKGPCATYLIVWRAVTARLGCQINIPPPRPLRAATVSPRCKGRLNSLLHLPLLTSVGGLQGASLMLCSRSSPPLFSTTEYERSKWESWELRPLTIATATVLLH